MHTYTNPFYSAHYTGSKPVYERDTTPKEYRGFQIFKIHADFYDVVRDGVLVAQMAGPRGAAEFVDGHPLAIA